MSKARLEPSIAIEGLARLAEGEGFSRIGSRMLAVLTVVGGPHSIDALAKRIGASRASISTNAKLLRSLGLIERVSRRSDRRDYLQVCGDTATVLLALGLRRLASFSQVIRAMRMAAPRRSHTHARIRRMEALYDTLMRRLHLELAG